MATTKFGPDDQNSPSLQDVQAQIEAMESQYMRFELDGSEGNGDGEEAVSLAASSKSEPTVQLPASNGAVPKQDPGTKSLVLSTFLSLVAVLILLGAVRLVLPQMLEWCRYAWARGQLRAEYEIAGEKLSQVSIDGLTQTSQLLAQRVSPSVVHIDLRRNRMEGEIKGRLGLLENLRLEQGSGVVVDEKGFILTNYHVIESEGKIEVQLSDGRVVPAEVIGVDSVTDLAVLKIEADRLMPIAWGNSDAMQVGMPVWAVGSPFGLAGSITFGILSGKHRIDLSSTRLQGSLKGQPEYSDLMQSDVAVNPGNSGGPLVNAHGELVGINTAIIGEHYRGVSFAIPSNVVKRVYEKLTATGKMERGVLGIVVDDEYHPRRTGEGVIGVKIRGFMAGSPGKKVGLEEGDIIVRIDGRAVEDLRDLRRIVGEAYIGANVEVEIDRHGESMSFGVTVAPIP